MMDGVPLKPAVVEERERHAGRERNLKEIAALVFLGSVFGVASNLLSLLHYLAGPTAIGTFLLCLFWTAADGFFCWAAWQLWRLRSLGRLASGGWALSLLIGSYLIWTAELPEEAVNEATVAMMDWMSNGLVIGMAGLATILLWLTFSKKTRRVLSLDYAKVIEQTPQISNRPSILAIIVLLLIALVLAFQLASLVFLVLTAFGV